MWIISILFRTGIAILQTLIRFIQMAAGVAFIIIMIGIIYFPEETGRLIYNFMRGVTFFVQLVSNIATE